MKASTIGTYSPVEWHLSDQRRHLAQYDGYATFLDSPMSCQVQIGLQGAAE